MWDGPMCTFRVSGFPSGTASTRTWTYKPYVDYEGSPFFAKQGCMLLLGHALALTEAAQGHGTGPTWEARLGLPPQRLTAWSSVHVGSGKHRRSRAASCCWGACWR